MKISVTYNLYSFGFLGRYLTLDFIGILKAVVVRQFFRGNISHLFKFNLSPEAFENVSVNLRDWEFHSGYLRRWSCQQLAH